MLHPKRKRFAVALGFIAAAGGCVFLATWLRTDPRLVQKLEDGSKIALTRFSYGNTNIFTHGKWLEQLFGDVIPKTGVKLGPFKLSRATIEPFPNFDAGGLILEFKRLGTNAPNPLPVSLRPRRTVRCVILGEDGSEYFGQTHTSRFFGRIAGITDFMDDELQTVYPDDFFNPDRSKYPEGEFEYVTASNFPRDSAWLTFRF